MWQFGVWIKNMAICKRDCELQDMGVEVIKGLCDQETVEMLRSVALRRVESIWQRNWRISQSCV